MNAYLANRPGAPVSTLSEIIALNNVIPGAIKYGQAIFEAADTLDLSPVSADTARYLSDRAADTPVVLGDARLALAHAPDRAYDLMILDAFSSDAIPLHLMTREALRLDMNLKVLFQKESEDISLPLFEPAGD